jgi:hypothetical protein
MVLKHTLLIKSIHVLNEVFVTELGLQGLQLKFLWFQEET